MGVELPFSSTATNVMSASVTTTRAVLDATVLGKTTIQEAIVAGSLRIEGDATRLGALFAGLDQPAGMMFEILTPGEGRP